MEVLAVITLGFGVVPLEGLSATAQVGRKKDTMSISHNMSKEEDNMLKVNWSRSVPLRYEADVAVIGGGIAGVSAACAAAKSDAKVVFHSSNLLNKFTTVHYFIMGHKYLLIFAQFLQDSKTQSIFS